MINKLFIAIVFLGNTLLFGQTGGLKGRIIDKESKEELSFSNVQLGSKGRVVANVIADISGQFTVAGLAPGVYELKAVCLGYEVYQTEGVIVCADKITQEALEMKPMAIMMCPVVICEYMEPLLDVCCYTRCSRTTCFFTCCSCSYEVVYGESDSVEISEKIISEEPVVCKVYPNPFMDFATLEIASEIDISYANVKLYDISGAEVREVNFSGRSVRIERDGLAAGTYLYVVSSADQSLANGRVVVQ